MSSPTAFGKTVIAAWLIARGAVNTLVLVHRRQLLDQWVQRLSAFLNVPPTDIGQIGGGRRKPTGLLDGALIQSLVRKGVVNDRVGEYGHLIVDECHHLSAQSFEQVVRRAKARFVLGLSATVTRKDGHHSVVFLQCGPVRYDLEVQVLSGEIGPEVSAVAEDRAQLHEPVLLEQVLPGRHVVTLVGLIRGATS